MTENKEYSCSYCVYRGTEVCEHCVTVQHPSGKIEKPTLFRTIESSAKFVVLGNSQVTFIKPQLGLKPKYIHDAQRAAEISAAIIRYLDSKVPIPIEWVEEYNEIRVKEKLAGKNKQQ